MHFRDTEQIKANSASDSIIYAIRKTIDKDMYTGQILSYRTGQQEMIGKELESEGFVRLFQTMQLYALVVIDICPLLLGHSKHCLLVQPPVFTKGIFITSPRCQKTNSDSDFYLYHLRIVTYLLYRIRSACI